MEQSYRHHYLICTKILPVQCLYETAQLSVLFANFPCTFISFCAIRETLFELSIDKQHQKHSSYDKSSSTDKPFYEKVILAFHYNYLDSSFDSQLATDSLQKSCK